MRIVVVAGAIAIAGCSAVKRNAFDMDRAANDKRYVAITRHRSVEDGFGRPRVHTCLEPTGAAIKLNDLSASLTAKVAEVEASASIENAQTLGQIYAVGEIMQLAHAGMYRLCEARSNVDITPQQYAGLYQDTLRTTAVLLCVQTRMSRDAEVAARKAEVELLKSRLAELEKQSAEKKEKADADEKRLAAKVAANKSLKDAVGLRGFEALVENPDLGSAAQEVVAARAAAVEASKQAGKARADLERASAVASATEKAASDTCDRMLSLLAASKNEIPAYSFEDLLPPSMQAVAAGPAAKPGKAPAAAEAAPTKN